MPLRPRRFAVQTTFAAAVAAVAACVAIGLGLWANSLSNKLDRERQAAGARAAALAVIADPAARRVPIAGHGATVAVAPSGTAALVASERYGAPVAAGLERLAGEVRRDRRRRAEEAARRVPVKLLFPLVGCTLPAFGLLTVAPLIAGALRALRLKHIL